MSESTRDQIFLSYAHEDLNMIRKIFNGLTERKLNVWFDKKHLRAGKWKPQITKAVARSRFFVICISKHALRKTGEKPGFQDDELNAAYNIAEAQPDTEFTIVPVRLEDCGRGDFRLTSFQQYDLFDNFENGLDKLAVNLGGISLSDADAKDERTNDEKVIGHLMGKAETAYYAGIYNKAITLWNSVLVIDPDHTTVWYNKGNSLCELGEYQKAIAAYNKAIELNPDYAVAWHNKGNSLYELGDYKKAFAAYDKAIELNPDDAAL